MKHREDYKYKVCIYCGLEWNVSIYDRYDFYICPVCWKKRGDKHAG